MLTEGVKYDNCPPAISIPPPMGFGLKPPYTGLAARPPFGVPREVCLQIRRMYIWRAPAVDEGRRMVPKTG